MDHVSIDNRATGTQKVLTEIEHFTRYASLIHVNNERASTTANELMERYSYSSVFLTLYIVTMVRHSSIL